MIPQAQLYVVTTDDFATLRLLGFNINVSDETAALIINTHFPNFNILSAALDSLSVIKPLADNTPLSKEIYITERPFPKLILRIIPEDGMDETIDGPAFIRSIIKKNGLLIAGHDLFVIPEEFRENRWGNKLMKIWAQQYINVGIDRIEVLASLKHGGLVWAKHFFTANKRSDVDVILQNAAKVLNGEQYALVRKMYDSYYDKNPNGQAFPMSEWAFFKFMAPVLCGSEWEGSIDFNNSEQLHNFISHIHKTK